MTDAVYGCDGCRTTIGRAGCPTHRDSNAYSDRAGAYHFTGSGLVITHCIHGLDLRLHPRCYLCNPAHEHGYSVGGELAALPADPDMEERLAGDLRDALTAEVNDLIDVELSFSQRLVTHLIAQGWRKEAPNE